MEQNDKFFVKAEVASFGCGAVRSASLHYFPGYTMVSVGIFQGMNVAAEAGACFSCRVAETVNMVTVSGLELCFGYSDICLFVVVTGGCYCGLVHDAFCKALSI